MYWNMRSMELLQRCAPLLEPHLTSTQQCIRLTRRTVWPSLLGASSGIGKPARANCESNVLPLGAEAGRVPLEPWLDSVADHFSHQNVRSVLLFVCGPAALVEAAQRAAKKDAPIDWRVHVERFEFLTLPARGAKDVVQDGLGEPTESKGDNCGENGSHQLEGQKWVSPEIHIHQEENKVGQYSQDDAVGAERMEVESIEGSVLGSSCGKDAAEDDRPSCMGFDWPSNQGAGAGPPETLHTATMSPTADRGLSGMGTWLAWRAEHNSGAGMPVSTTREIAEP